jgi:predicted RecB family nuclease
MRLVASDIYSLYSPSQCPRRVFLRANGVKAAPPGPYDQVIERLGHEHEKACLAELPAAVDLSSGSPQEREARTRAEIAKGTAVIYQGRLSAKTVLGGVDCEIVGEPDFLIPVGPGRCVVGDAKMSRRITEEDHLEILLQVGLYGWLVQQVTGNAPAGLQVHAGTGEVVDLPYDGGAAALAVLETIATCATASNEPYSPVGWTKCASCGFYETCWRRAEQERDVALLSGVDQNLAVALRRVGVNTFDDLLGKFTEPQLAAFQKPWGSKTQKVGKRAGSILLQAKAMTTGKEIQLAKPDLPDRANWVMFDLEGLPPQLDETGKIYLWGMQVFGQQPGPYLGVTAGFGRDGDERGWVDFLENAAAIFREYGDICFVHWHHYERVHVDEYSRRFGDPNGVAARVCDNLLDLLPITRESIALPLPSYSLKVVEKYVGFKRTQAEFGGNWSMAKYIEAVELQDQPQRDAVMGQILTYNEEDLKATWAVLSWLKGYSRPK